MHIQLDLYTTLLQPGHAYQVTLIDLHTDIQFTFKFAFISCCCNVSYRTQEDRRQDSVEYCYLELVCWLWETVSSSLQVSYAAATVDGLLTHNLANVSYITCSIIVCSISWYFISPESHTQLNQCFIIEGNVFDFHWNSY